MKRAIKVATGADHTLVLLSPSLPSLADDSSDELVDTAEWRQDVQEVTRPLLPSLQELCQRELLKSVNLRNVLDGLSFAEQFHAKTLASYCLEYIQGNFDAILVQTNPSKIEKYIDDWYWPMQLHSMSKVACRKWEVDAKAILPPNANIPTFESKSLKVLSVLLSLPLIFIYLTSCVSCLGCAIV